MAETQVDLLKKYQLSVRGHLGQHILIDPNIQQKVADLLEIEPSDSILEIGPGLGALTARVAERCKQFTAIETDENFVRILKQEFPFLSSKTHQVLHSDILKFDLKKLAPKAVRKKWKVISNLPYYITAPIIFHLLESRRLFSKFVFTMQKEVADRLLADPGTKSYGRLTIGVRYAGSVRHAFDIPPSCFTPRPAVGSSVVVMDLYPEKQLLAEKEEKQLFELVRIAFSQRRKMFLSLLASNTKIRKSRQQIEAVFAKAGISPQARGEELMLKDYLALVRGLSPS